MLWLAGLCVHTPSLTAALPGLSHRRALLLNLSGSFVSNLLPLGGAAGTVVNWRMARTWGFSSGAFGRWAVVTNLSDTVVKLALPGLVLCWFAARLVRTAANDRDAAAVGAALLVVTVLAVALVARDDRCCAAPGRWADRAAARVRAIPTAPEGYGERAAGSARDSARLVRDGWGRMLGASSGTRRCRRSCSGRACGSSAARSRPSSSRRPSSSSGCSRWSSLTPGATGVVEVGMAGVLGALGAEPAAAAAGVLLYRGLVVGMEVPVGGLALLGWWVGHRRVAASETASALASRSAPGPCVRTCSSCRCPLRRWSAGSRHRRRRGTRRRTPATSSGCSVP